VKQEVIDALKEMVQDAGPVVCIERTLSSGEVTRQWEPLYIARMIVESIFTDEPMVRSAKILYSELTDDQQLAMATVKASPRKAEVQTSFFKPVNLIQ
jgi:hypothetical protein